MFEPEEKMRKIMLAGLVLAVGMLGVFAGADFKFNKTFSLSLEGRFFDETAMSLAALFAF